MSNDLLQFGKHLVIEIINNNEICEITYTYI